MAAVQETVDRVRSIEVDAYKYGFISPIESDLAPKGLREDTVRFISQKKFEPEWLLDWRLEAFRRWKTMEEPKWARVSYPPIDYQSIYYFAAPKRRQRRSRSTRLIRSCCGRTPNLASRWLSKRSSRVSRTAGWRLTPSSTPFRSQRPSRRSLQRQGSFFAPSPKRSEITPSSCAAI